MIPFATEFAVKDFERSEFVGLALAWLKGSDYCTLFDEDAITDLSSEVANIKSLKGEEIKFHELKDKNATDAIGFRYEKHDDQGRIWRTEFVVTQGNLVQGDAILRTRTQCLAKLANVELEPPKKPFILKSIIQDGLTVDDGYFSILDKPHRLIDNDFSIEIIKETLLGNGSNFLPVVYITMHGDGSFSLSEKQIERLAFELGGVAHVVVEPSRTFSAKLRDSTDGQNAYGGSIGVYLPQAPIGKKFYIGGAIKDSFELCKWLSGYCIAARSRLPSKGWDWTELQEQALRRQRERDRNSLSVRETEELYEQEIDTLKERIKELEIANAAISTSTVRNSDYKSQWDQDSFSMSIPEIYTGEISDRIQFLIDCGLQQAEALGIDERTIAVAKTLLQHNSKSAELKELREQLGKVITNPKRYSKDVVKLLEKYGYSKKAEKTHVRLEPDPNLEGVSTLTIVKTPSDHRSLKNQRSHIENGLGISKL